MILDGPWRFSLLGYPVGFFRPVALLLCVVAVALGIWAYRRAKERQRRLQGLVAPRHMEKVAPGLSARRGPWRAALTSLALFCFAFALARPQCGSHSELTKRRGIDLIVALDASKSMHARDVVPNRLERAKLELASLLDELKGDRVGIVAFAGDAFVQCPLTSDYSAAKLFLRAIDPNQMPEGGTNIGAALRLSLQTLQGADRGSKDRVIVLLSDGEDLSGDIDGELSSLKEAGVRVYAVGIGSETGEPIPVFDRQGNVVGFKKDEHGETVMSRLDLPALERIAKETGGEVFHEDRGVAMSEVSRRIDSLQKSELESRLTVQYAERYQLFAGLGLGLLVAASLVFPSWRRK